MLKFFQRARVGTNISKTPSEIRFCPFFFFLLPSFTFGKTNENEHGGKFFCERMECAVMQARRVDVVCCTFAETPWLCYRREPQKQKNEEFVVVVVFFNLSVARCWECSGGGLEWMLVSANMPYHF